MRRYCFRGILLLIVISFAFSACSSGVSSMPENVFEEIYGDMVSGCDMIERVSAMEYNKSWDNHGTPWHGDVGYIYYNTSSNGQNYMGEIFIYGTKNEATLTFVHSVKKGDGEAYYSYRYALSSKELTYSTNDYEATTADMFLYDVVLNDWYRSNQPNEVGEPATAFSPENWGQYVTVLPYQ